MTRTIDPFGFGDDPPPEPTGTPREVFITLLGVLKEHKATLSGLQDELNVGFQGALRALWGAQGFKGKFTPTKLIEKDEKGWDTLKTEWESRGETVYATWATRRDELSNKLDALAEENEVLSGLEWHLFYRVSSSDYSTQGLGASTYAKRSAERRMAEVSTHGLEAEVRTVLWREKHKEDPYLSKSDNIDFEVWVKSEPIDLEVVRRKPGMTIKEFLKWCWGNGVNPRVYDPWLPAGLESKLGLDYFGNEVAS